MDFRIIDIAIFVIANLINLLLIGIFLSRPKGLKKVEHVLGLFVVAMIGYSFLIGKTYGFVTLGTYFLGLFATWYSYSKVGHGKGH